MVTQGLKLCELHLLAIIVRVASRPTEVEPSKSFSGTVALPENQTSGCTGSMLYLASAMLPLEKISRSHAWALNNGF
jgi:hypothetical protein